MLISTQILLFSFSFFYRLKLKLSNYCGKIDILHLVIKKNIGKKKTPIIYLLGDKINIRNQG